MIAAGNQELLQRAPVDYQERGRERQRVAAAYVVEGDRVRLRLGDYDRDRPLVIDPVLAFSTYLGGPCTDYMEDVAVDAAGDVWAVGRSCDDAWVVKMRGSDHALLFDRRIGGVCRDDAESVAIGAGGMAVVVGRTCSEEFPLVGALQPTKQSYFDAFVLGPTPDGTRLVFSTFLGGSGDDETAMAVSIGGGQDIFVGGLTDSTDFPTTPGVVRPTNPCRVSGFVARLTPLGEAMMYGTYFGGGPCAAAGDSMVGRDHVTAIAADGAGSAVIGGWTWSPDLPVLNAFQPVHADSGACVESMDGFLAKLDGGGRLIFSSYLGSPGIDGVDSLALDANGVACVVGGGGSPATTATFGGTTGFVAAAGPSGALLAVARIAAGLQDVAVRDHGAIVAVGSALESLPLVNPIQPEYGGEADAAVVVLSPALDTLRFFLGGSMGESAFGVAVAPHAPAVYVCGITFSGDFHAGRALPDQRRGLHGRVPGRDPPRRQGPPDATWLGAREAHRRGWQAAAARPGALSEPRRSRARQYPQN